MEKYKFMKKIQIISVLVATFSSYVSHLFCGIIKFFSASPQDLQMTKHNNDYVRNHIKPMKDE